MSVEKKTRNEMHENEDFEIVFSTNEDHTAFPEDENEKDVIIKDLQMQLAEAKARSTLISLPNSIGIETQADTLTVTREALAKQLEFDSNLDEDLHLKIQYLNGIQSQIIRGIDKLQSNTENLIKNKEAEMFGKFEEYVRERAEGPLEPIQSEANQETESGIKEKLMHSLAQLQTAQAAAFLLDKKLVDSQLKVDLLERQMRTLETEKKDILRDLVASRRECKQLKSDLSRISALPKVQEKQNVDRSTAVDSEDLKSVAVELFEKERKHRNQISRLTRKLRSQRLNMCDDKKDYLSLSFFITVLLLWFFLTAASSRRP